MPIKSASALKNYISPKQRGNDFDHDPLVEFDESCEQLAVVDPSRK